MLAVALSFRDGGVAVDDLGLILLFFALLLFLLSWFVCVIVLALVVAAVAVVEDVALWLLPCRAHT